MQKATAAHKRRRLKISMILSVFKGVFDEAVKEGMGAVGTALELRMELHADKPGMTGVLDDFHQPSVRRKARKLKDRKSVV